MYYQHKHASFNTLMLLERAVAFVTRGKIPYSANSPTKDDMKIYLSSSVTWTLKCIKKGNKMEYKNYGNEYDTKLPQEC